MQNPNTYEHLSLDVKSVLLTPYDRSQIIDIKPLCTEFHVYESIFSHFVAIEIIIEDAKGLIERFPIVGDEKIGISFRTPSLEEYVEMEFDLYKTSPIVKNGERSRSYVLFGVSPEQRVNVLREVRNSHTGTCKDIVKNIFHTHFTDGDLFPRSKEVVASDTLGTQHFVGVGETPFNFIRKIAKEAESPDYPASNFTFYETLERKFYFKTIDEMIDSDVFESYYYADAASLKRNERSESDTVHDYKVILDLQIDGIPDTLKTSITGGYRNAVKCFDPVTKTYAQKDFKYGETDQLKMLGSEKIIPEVSLYRDVESSVHERFLRATVLNDYVREHITEETDKQYFYYRRRNRFAHLDVASRELLNAIKLQCTISGASDLHVGSVVNIFVSQDSNDEEFSKIYNIFYGGEKADANGVRNAKFLVTSLTHTFKFDNNSFATTFECVKNSYASKIQTEGDRLSNG